MKKMYIILLILIFILSFNLLMAKEVKFALGDIVLVDFGGVETEEHYEWCKIIHIKYIETDGISDAHCEYTVINLCDKDSGATVVKSRFIKHFKEVKINE